ncbi:MazG nucleotide pyrophosphohydrolase [Thioalkalivibrio nitratireducens DSM 14787]|uniref:MazG nucleotide pyrophosphohydrolase n=2 Tax=Thioalkalivibrio nitratireducens TaxID=186931 RepID=L0DWW9_THIND|nr:MazG nucleotide pyrophosphohydrolase [Thioalkalivibrio nitratireducens DSM 14787]
MEWQEMDDLKRRMRDFAERRDWDQFHAPKNLAMALAGEAGELIEHFQWLTEQQSAELDARTLEKVASEIADIQIYLVRLADKLGVSIADAVENKIVVNERKYPVEKVYGSARKYTDYDPSR